MSDEKDFSALNAAIELLRSNGFRVVDASAPVSAAQTMAVDLNAVREALAKATPGPWSIDRHLAMLCHNGGAPVTGEANWDLIVVAVNALPAMADELESLRAEKTAQDAVVARLREALEYISGSHIPDQPESSSGDELIWAQQHVAKLRRIARAALANGASQ